MKSNDITEDVMRPFFDQQAKATARIRRRKATQAKLMLVAVTAVASSYATYTVMRYMASGDLDAISLALLAIFGAIIGERWRSLP